MIEAKQLTRRFGDTAAVVDVSFTVKRGEIVGFLGHNGAGKSTTMRMLAGALVPSSGRATVEGNDSTTIEARRLVGWLPETPPLTAELTVDEQLRFVASARGIGRAQVGAAVDGVVARCDLGCVRRKLTATLSKGTKQRVGLAQALLGDPPALLLDEPTAGLDPKQAASVRELLRALAADHAILLSTHLLHEVASLCSRALLVSRGRLVADATVDALRARGPSLEHTVLAALDGGAGDVGPEAQA